MTQQKKDVIVIGYFALRAKAQVCRLLCEYLGLPYQERFYTPEQWSKFEKNEGRNWIIKALPYLQDGNFVVTGQHGIIQYIIRKSNRLNLLGNTLTDRIKIDTFKSKHDIKDNIIALICQMNRNNSKSPVQPLNFYWQEKFLPKLTEFQNNCKENDWYLGYLTILDFSFYQMMNNLQWLFPHLVTVFPKLLALRDRVKDIPSINQYQNSERSLKIFNPYSLFEDFQKKLRSKQSMDQEGN